jgi:hypothetical protein
MTLEKTIKNLRHFGWFKRLKEFSIKTNNSFLSKKIINSLISLGFKNPSNFCGDSIGGYYQIIDKKIRLRARIDKIKTPLITLEEIPYK